MPLSPIKQYVLSIHSYVYVILGCIFKLGDKFLFQTNEEEFYFIYAHVSLPGAKSNICLQIYIFRPTYEEMKKTDIHKEEYEALSF